MRHYIRFKLVLAFYVCYLGGGFFSALFVMAGNKVGMVLAVLVPTILVLCYMSLVVHSTQPAGKKAIPRRASRLKVVR